MSGSLVSAMCDLPCLIGDVGQRQQAWRCVGTRVCVCVCLFKPRSVCV